MHKKTAVKQQGKSANSAAEKSVYIIPKSHCNRVVQAFKTVKTRKISDNIKKAF